jgi:cytoskeletal protein RodZ
MLPTIGQRLKAEREARKLTLEKVFEVTRIRVPYLQALETDDLSSVPSPVQARGYLRNYAEFLGLDFHELLDEMRANMQGTSGEVIGPAEEAPPPFPRLSEEEESASPSTQATFQTLYTEHLDLARNTPASIQDETPAAKAKPSRRKKTASPSGSSSEASGSKRRGRKKTQPEPEPAPEPETADSIQNESMRVEEPIAQVDSIPQVDPGPNIAPTLAVPEEPVPQNEASDTLWQTWLNRLGSVISARGRRRTLVPRGQISSENNLEVDLQESYPASQAAQSLPLAESTAIFKEIGQQLRERRELLSLHLDEVERNTHVRVHYLAALEKGAMDELPSTVQTRGMLSNYATFLDMDVDVLLLRFADALQARHRERNPQKPGRKPGQPIVASVPPIRTFIAGDIIFGIGMVVLLVGFAIWGVSRVVAIRSEQEIPPTAPSIPDVLLAPPDPSQLSATQTIQPVESLPGPATETIVVPTQDASVEVQLNLVASERTYMRVVVDGEVAFDGRVVPGNAYPFQAETQIEVLVGSGAAIRTVYNGRDLGLMGTFGQVVTNIYTANEVITPTALASPSATATAPVTGTVSPTATPSVTNTPALSGTPTP